ncbi:MAG: hydrogenase nickel incorporation protein HypB [Armatimonadia bacterium]|nr:hydrogenase nickel incorporation protein HypB [Armatimonadia bacterium]
MRIDLSRDVLAGNDSTAEANQRALADAGVLCVGLLSSPGAGKTTLLEATADAWGDASRLAVIVGDVATEADADRLRDKGIPSIQINTQHHGATCHLTAESVTVALAQLDLDSTDLLFVENVGNLVCPVGFRLGEHRRVVLISVAEGADKPIKYPKAILETDLALVTKTDLAPYVDVSLESLTHSIRQVKPNAEILGLSTKTGDGMAEWVSWLRELKAGSVA